MVCHPMFSLVHDKRSTQSLVLQGEMVQPCITIHCSAAVFYNLHCSLVLEGALLRFVVNADNCKKRRGSNLAGLVPFTILWLFSQQFWFKTVLQTNLAENLEVYFWIVGMTIWKSVKTWFMQYSIGACHSILIYHLCFLITSIIYCAKYHGVKYQVQKWEETLNTVDFQMKPCLQKRAMHWHWYF